jgi:hypothetical protein
MQSTLEQKKDSLTGTLIPADIPLDSPDVPQIVASIIGNYVLSKYAKRSTQLETAKRKWKQRQRHQAGKNKEWWLWDTVGVIQEHERRQIRVAIYRQKKRVSGGITLQSGRGRGTPWEYVVDVRRYYLRTDGQWAPTLAGVRLGVPLVSQFLSRLAAVCSVYGREDGKRPRRTKAYNAAKRG